MTIEERLQMQLGMMMFQIQVLQSQLDTLKEQADEKDKEIAKLKNGHDQPENK